VLTDDAPEPGQDYAMAVVDSEGWRQEFFLRVVVVDEDTAICNAEAVAS
jgi:hypothetical protein